MVRWIRRAGAWVSPLLALAAGTPVAVLAQSSSAEQEVIEALTGMWAAIEEGDVETYGQYVHADFTALGENDVYLAEGKDLELRSYRDYLSRARDVHTEMHQPRVTIRGDVAWITYYWTDSGWIGGARFTSRGKSTRIFVRENGEWLCIHGHYTAVP